jgi:hypothetical protein
LNDEEIQLKSFAAGLWASMAMAAVALLIAIVGMRWGMRPNQPEETVEQTTEVVKAEKV